MDRFHPERATRLNSTQRRYYEIFGKGILRARNSAGLRHALSALVASDSFREVAGKFHADSSMNGMNDVLVGVRQAIRESLVEMDVDDCSFPAIRKAGLNLAFSPVNILLMCVYPDDRAELEAMVALDDRSIGVLVEFATHAWERAGRKIYSVTPGLRQKLKNTELRGVRSCDFRLPYRCVYVDLSGRGEAGIVLPHGVPVEGVYLFEDRMDGNRVVNLVIISAGGTGGALLSGSLNYGTEESDFPWAVGIVLPDGSMIKDCMSSLSHTPLGADQRTPGIKYTERTIQGAEEIFNYILNVVMYTTMPGLDACVAPCDPRRKTLLERAMRAKKGSKRREKLLHKAEGMSDQSMVVLGGNLYVDKGKERGESGDGTGSKVAVRTLAAGHWKHVVHGAGRKERRLTWIEPYWRGPDLGPVSQKKHVLTDGSSRGRM